MESGSLSRTRFFLIVYLLRDESDVRKSLAKLKKKNAPKKPTWVACGFDISVSSLSGAAYMYDGLLDKLRGPTYVQVRWNQGEHYFERCLALAKGHEFVLDLIGQMKGAVADTDEVYIAVEEPWPFGVVKRAQSSWLKQQAQMQGVFIGSLLRWGYNNVFEINNQDWKNIVREDLGRSLKRGREKWDVKEWAIQSWGAPDKPDLIQSKHGMVPKPATSVAKPKQPDDIYDAVAILDWMRTQVEKGIGHA
jgi:hypothetical protein